MTLKFHFIKNRQRSSGRLDKLGHWGIFSPLNIHNALQNNSIYAPFTTRCALYRTEKGELFRITYRRAKNFKIHKNYGYEKY